MSKIKHISTPRLEPEVGAAMFSKEPASVFVSLPEIKRAFGLSDKELLLELQTGALVASGCKTGSGWEEVAVRADHLANWMAITGFTIR